MSVVLGALQLFRVLAIIVNPIVEHQIGRTVEEGVNTNSYLTEALTGIQTIKSQNAELKTRWAQERYTRFIGEDFKLRVTGERLEPRQAWRARASPPWWWASGWCPQRARHRRPLRLSNHWWQGHQPHRAAGPNLAAIQIQSRNLTLAADVVDRPTEQSDVQASNIPMPTLRGMCPFSAVDFATATPDKFANVTLEVSEGTFVNMVGGSGSANPPAQTLTPLL